jgi:hypothetical protein
MVCGDTDHHTHMGFMPFFRGMCYPMMEPSKETRIKSLEALKSKLEDYLKHIDERIAELEKEKK